MFKVEVDSLEAYFNFDQVRKPELMQFDQMMRQQLPRLKCYFHAGTPAGQPGMRFKMIGYGAFETIVKGGRVLVWPRVGLALQKNYISVYLAGEGINAILQTHRGDLGETRMGEGNFSFVRFSQLAPEPLAAVLNEVAQRLGREG